MLIESNRLHQKIKRLKEELTREKDLRREAEKQLRFFKESISSNHKNQVLEMTKPDNIAVTISSNFPCDEINRNVSEVSNEIDKPSESNDTNKDKTIEFLNRFSKTLVDQNETEIHICYNEYKRYISIWNWPDSLEEIIGTENNDALLLLRELSQRTNVIDPPNSMSWSIYTELLSNQSLLDRLPAIWINDIIDAFVYKFQSLHHYSSENDTCWSKELLVKKLEELLSKNENEKLTTIGMLVLIHLLRFHVFLEDYQSTTKLISHVSIDNESIQILEPEVSTMINYEIGFAFLITGKTIDAVHIFENNLNILSKHPSVEEEFSSMKNNTKRCIALCLSTNAKIKKSLSKNTLSSIESVYQKDIEDWKDGQVEAYWNFFSRCSPYLLRQQTFDWKIQNLKSIKFCLQRVTMWKPLRYLKGLLKVIEVLPFGAIPKSILPVTSESDIKFFCDNNNGLKRLVNAKSSAIERVLEDFPNIHQTETLILLIMQYHKILLKQKNEDKVLAFGRKFVNVLKTTGYSGKLNVEDAMCYIREVAKISMEQANKIVEDQCNPV